MKKIILFAVMVSFVLACGNTGPSAKEIADGKETYKKICVACHGPNGQLALNGAKKFTESTMTLDERITIITNGKGLMTPFKGVLKEEEIRAVAAYTIELGKQ